MIKSVKIKAVPDEDLPYSTTPCRACCFEEMSDCTLAPSVLGLPHCSDGYHYVLERSKNE